MAWGCFPVFLVARLIFPAAHLTLPRLIFPAAHLTLPHPGFGRARVHKRAQPQRATLRLPHGEELRATPAPRHHTAFHEQHLIGQVAQEVQAVLNDNNRQALLFKYFQGRSHLTNRSGVQV